jgi:seryl-tRNA synthetase
MDQQAFELARLQQENRALRAQLEAVKKTKRKKVAVDPNTVFASIEQIHRAQVEVGRIEEDVEEESGSEIAVSEASCIVVGSKRR